MILIDSNGVVEVIIEKPCGNPIPKGNRIVPNATCKALNKTQPDAVRKPNTYHFTTNAEFGPNTTLSRVVYHFSDGTPDVTTHSLTDVVEHTFTKSGTVTVKVFARVPGNHEIEAKAMIECSKKITVIPPHYVCKALVATVLDNEARKFRFTAKAASDPNTTLKSAEFSLDGTAAIAATAKDADGNFYKDYSFTDAVKHTIAVTLSFNTVDGVKSVTCQASVTPKKQPKCELPGKENFPPNAPECQEIQYCLPNIPVGDARCNPPQDMPKTGPGNVLGLFAGVSGAGAVAHRMFMNRRARRG